MSDLSSTLRKLVAIDTPTICNVVELFEVRPRDTGYMDGRIRAVFPEMKAVAGFAVTTSFTAKASSGHQDGYGSFAEQFKLFAELPGPAIMVFQDIDDPPVAATFGDVMCSSYKAFGAVGLITSGAGRDLDHVRSLGFPVFTGGTICSHGYGRWLQIGQPVDVGGIQVKTGDLLHCDANGVATIPLDIADEVADLAPQFIAAEDITVAYNRSPGKKSIHEFMERRLETENAIAKLQQSIQWRRS